MSCRRNSLLAGAVLLGCLGAGAAPPEPRFHPQKPGVGAVCLLELRGAKLQQAVARVRPAGASSPEVQLADGERRIAFVQAGPERWIGLLGIDLEDPAGIWEMELLALDPLQPGAQHQSVELEVAPRAYPVQKLSLPPSKVDLAAKDLERVERESAAVDAVFALRSAPPWRLGPFVHPLEAHPAGDRFGSRRVINGEAKAQHSGADYKAARGTAVRAMADGLVVLAAEHFFAGRSVFVDHGGGLISMYFHLEEIGVREGQALKAGERLGTVGATGRVTGPHLHFGVRVNGARVDPDSLLALTALLREA